MVWNRFIKAACFLLICWPSAHSFCQANILRKVDKKILKGNWAGAHQLLTKVLAKDTANVELELSLAHWFINDKNPSQQIDSAYQHTLFALWNFQMASPKKREKLKRNQTDSVSIVSFRTLIDSLAFEQAKQVNTEKAYQNFLSIHENANEKPVAVELRDEVAFLNTLRQNTYTAFEDYIQRYPESHRVKEAKERSEKLLFEAKTKDKKLKSYLAFAKAFPASPYKVIADKNIFELTTCGGDPADLEQFLNDYPQNHFFKQARNILFHVLKESDEKIPLVWMTDSLSQAIEINKLTWAPVYKNGKYGFIDSKGNETFAPQFENIDEEYKCGSIKEDVLSTSSGLVSRNAKLLTTASNGVDIGYGFLKIGDSSCVQVIHKSGFKVIDECLQDAGILGGRFLVVEKNDLLGLYGLNGRMLQPIKWNSIEQMEGVIVFDSYGKKILCTSAQLVKSADGNPFPESMVFDNVKVIEPGLLLVNNGSLEGILNSNLEFVVPLERQSLRKLRFGLVRKINDQYIFAGLSPALENRKWDSFSINRQWLVLRRNPGEEKLFDTYSKKWAEADSDSLWFEKGLAFARLGDSVYVHINSTSKLSLFKNEKVNFVKSPDSIRYFYLEKKTKKTVFSIESGEKLFTVEADQIESLTPDTFIITNKKNKKGLLNKLGKTILATDYDALVLINATQVSLLKEKKIGLYDLNSKKLIKPIFERNISMLDNETLIAFKEGHYGLMDWNSKAITPFEFDEILPWTENEIWAKKGFEWMLYDFKESKKVLVRIKGFHVFKDKPDEKLAMVQQENFYGVLSSTQGMIIPTSFSYITNLASAEEPLYFTAKEIEEASIVVVIYYNKEGKLLRKQVYEDEEYARIVCEDN